MRQSHRVLSISVLPALLALTSPAFRIYNACVSTSLLRIITPLPRRGCSLSCPLCSALDSAQWESDRSIYSHNTKHPKPHTKILVKAVLKPLQEHWQQRGYAERLTLAKGNEHPMHPFQSAVNGECKAILPLSHLLGTLFLSINNRELISCGLSSPKPHTVQMQLRLYKNN